MVSLKQRPRGRLKNILQCNPPQLPPLLPTSTSPTRATGSSSGSSPGSSSSPTRPCPSSRARSRSNAIIARPRPRPIDPGIVRSYRPARARPRRWPAHPIIRIPRVHPIIGDRPAVDARAGCAIHPVDIIVHRAVLTTDHPDRQQRRSRQNVNVPHIDPSLNGMGANCATCPTSGRSGPQT